MASRWVRPRRAYTSRKLKNPHGIAALTVIPDENGERWGWLVKLWNGDTYRFPGTKKDYPHGTGPTISGRAIIEGTEMVDFKRKEDLK